VFQASLPQSFLRRWGIAMDRLTFLRRLLWDEDGPTAVEYAVMLALIVGVCVGAITFLGTQTTGSFENSKTKISAAMGS
jgi:pilus assembly protein Flp/PilA